MRAAEHAHGCAVPARAHVRRWLCRMCVLCRQEECVLELFDWRSIDADSQFDSAKEQLRMEREARAKSAQRHTRHARPDDDEYEIDEEAEAEAHKAERLAEVRSSRADEEAEAEAHEDDMEISSAHAHEHSKRNGHAARAAV